MKTLGKLLTIFIAVTLALSVVSVANPSYFIGGFNAYADNQDDTKSNSGHGNNADHDSPEQEHEQGEEECGNDEDEQEAAEDEEQDIDEEAESEEEGEEEASEDQQGEDGPSDDQNGEGSEDEQETSEEDVAEDETDEQDEEDDNVNEEEGGSEGESSEQESEDNNGEQENSGESNEEESEEEVTNEEEVEQEAVEENKVEDEHEGCNKEEEMPEEEVEEEQESKIKWELDDNGIEVEIDLKGITTANGMYDVVFSCTEPVISETFAGGYEVKDGEGEFETKLSLPTGAYNGCVLIIQDETILEFDSFNIVGEADVEVEEKREQKRHAIVNSITGADIHQRHLHAEPASTGDYQPGWSYSVVAAGIAEDDEDNLADASVDMDIAVWKSNSAVVLMDVLGGQVEIGDQSYTVAIGYALYSTHSDILRINALVIDDATGDVVKMKMRGIAIAEDADFPTDTGSLELEFEGNSGPSKNEVDGWELMLDGTVAAA